MLESMLERAGSERSKEKNKWLCPFHNENSGSLHISEHDGAWHFKCFGCGKRGDVFDVQAHVERRTVDEIFTELSNEARPRKTQEPKKQDVIYKDVQALDAAVKYIYCKNDVSLEDSYQYVNPATKLVDLVVYRLKMATGKRFVQATPLNGGFVLRNAAVTNPIYNRTAILSSKQIIIVEGEKKVKLLRTLQVTGTCSPGGSNAAAKADWGPLAGKDVVIWPDNDPSGFSYAEAVIAELKKLKPQPTIRVVRVEDLNLGPKDDVVDFCNKYPFLEQRQDAVLCAIESSRSTGAVADLDQEIQDALDGKRYPIEFPWQKMSDMTYALVPGGTMLLCGSPGGSKSLMTLQFLRHFIKNEIPSCIYELEDGAAYHLRRVWAQICGEGRLTRDVWCKNNQKIVAECKRFAKDDLAKIASHIESPPDRTFLTAKALVVWVQKKCDEGNRVIIIDPITKMAKGKMGFMDDEEFLDGAQRAVERAKASLILVTHPKKSTQKGYDLSMDDLAGGVAYRNFGQCIVYLKAHEMKCEMVKSDMGEIKSEYDKTLVIFKARNSYGAGKALGFLFNPTSLTLSEQGVIQE